MPLPCRATHCTQPAIEAISGHSACAALSAFLLRTLNASAAAAHLAHAAQRLCRHLHEAHGSLRGQQTRVTSTLGCHSVCHRIANWRVACGVCKLVCWVPGVETCKPGKMHTGPAQETACVTKAHRCRSAGAAAATPRQRGCCGGCPPASRCRCWGRCQRTVHRRRTACGYAARRRRHRRSHPQS